MPLKPWLAKRRENEETSTESASFEERLASLEGAVDQLEGGDLSLEEAIAEFQKGFRAWQHCQEHLQNAEKRIEVLCEELPAGYVAPALAGLEAGVLGLLKGVPRGDCRRFSTPRRLCVVVEGLAAGGGVVCDVCDVACAMSSSCRSPLQRRC